MDHNRNQSSVRRAKYKELLDLGSAIESSAQNDGAISTLKRITKIVKKSDELNAEGRYQDRVENTTEVVMDAQVMKMTHELMGSIIQTMDNTEISDDEFVAAINRTVGVTKDWEKLAEIGLKMSKTFYYSPSLFGTFEEETVIPQKQAKERAKQTKSKNTQQTKPIAVTQQRKEDQAAEKINIVISQILKLFNEKNNEPLPYYKIIIDPNNFMNTIQNAFQVSFLFRDGILVFGKDKYGYPTIRPAMQSDTAESDNSTHQMVSNLTAKLCDEMIQRYKITEPCLLLDNS